MKKMILAAMVVMLAGLNGFLWPAGALANAAGPVNAEAFGKRVDYDDGILADEYAVNALSLEEDLVRAYVKLQASSLQTGEEAVWVVTAAGAKEPVSYYFRLYRQELTDESNLYWAVDGSALTTGSNVYRFVIPSEGRYFLKFEITDGNGESIVFKSEPYETLTDDLSTKIVEVLSECISDGLSDYEKALRLHDWLCENAEYDDELQNFQLDGVLLEGKGVCQSFALAYQLLLTEAGIDNIFVVGSAGGVSHGWNLVNMGGEWYHVDVTWDEARLDRYYFGMTTELISRDHTIDSRIPEATALKCNYAMNRADGVFTSLDELEGLIDSLPADQLEFMFYYAGAGNIDDQIEAWLNENGAMLGIIDLECDSSGALTRYITGQRKHPEALEVVGWESSPGRADGKPVLNVTLETGMKTAVIEMESEDGVIIGRFEQNDGDNGRRQSWIIFKEFADDGETVLKFRAVDADGCVVDEVSSAFLLEGYGIHDVEAGDGIAVLGQKTSISAETNLGAVRLNMYTEDGRLVRSWAAEEYSEKAGNVRVWKVWHAFSGLGRRLIGFDTSTAGGESSGIVKKPLIVMKAPDVLEAKSPRLAYKGETVVMTIRTEETARYLSMYSESGAKVRVWNDDSSELVDGERVWTLFYALSGSGKRTLTFRASMDGVHEGSSVSGDILISEAVPDVGYAAFRDNVVGRRAEAGITAVTNADAQILMMYAENGTLAKKWNADEVNSTVEGTERIWNVEYAFSGIGKRMLTFRASKEGENTGCSVKAGIEVVSDYTLKDVCFLSDTARTGEKTGITAESGWTARYLSLYSEADVLVKTWSAEKYSSVSDVVRYWNVEYAFSGAGDRKPIFRTSEDGSMVSGEKRADILIVSGAPAVCYAAFETDAALKGESVGIIVRTNTDAERVIMYSEAGVPAKTWAADEVNSKVSGTEKIWTLSYAFRGEGARKLTFRAADSSGATGADKTAAITIE